MPPTSQKAGDRPVAFVFHNLANGDAPVFFPLVIRPEELTRTDTSRLSVAQTMGGAWVDSWGAGLPMVQISGTTGWGQGGRPDGQEQFKALYHNVFKRWHDAREEQSKKDGGEPDKVKLVFADYLDDFVWVVAPQGFTLRRSKSRPLLSQYNIGLVKVGDDVQETLSGLSPTEAFKLTSLQESLSAAMGKIKSFLDWLKTAGGMLDTVRGITGTVRQAVGQFARLTYDALGVVNSALAGGKSLVSDITGDVLNIAGNLSRAAANIINTYRNVTDLPARASAQFGRVSAAFQNVWCLLANNLRSRRFFRNYDDLYGAANCSSTAGGAPVSRYDTENPFPALLPIPSGGRWIYTPDAAASLNLLSANDPATARLTPENLQVHMGRVNDGLRLAA